MDEERSCQPLKNCALEVLQWHLLWENSDSLINQCSFSFLYYRFSVLRLSSMLWYRLTSVFSGVWRKLLVAIRKLDILVEVDLCTLFAPLCDQDLFHKVSSQKFDLVSVGRYLLRVFHVWYSYPDHQSRNCYLPVKYFPVFPSFWPNPGLFFYNSSLCYLYRLYPLLWDTLLRWHLRSYTLALVV